MGRLIRILSLAKKRRPAGWRAAYAFAFLSATAFASTNLWADASADRAGAERLFISAKERMAHGDFAGACPELAESESLDPQIGTALNLAYCEEHLGRTSTAWLTWLQAAAAAAAKGDKVRQQFAESQARLLEPQLLRVIVLVTPQPARDRMRLAIDDTPLPQTEWGAPVPVDPGAHEVVAVADGFRAWRWKLMAVAGIAPTVVVPQLEPIATTVEPEGPAKRPPSSAWPAVMWTTGAAGVAALGVGGGFGIAALVNDDASNANGKCTARGCNPQGVADRERSNRDALVADVLYATGGAAVLASAAIFIVLRTGRGTQSDASWTVGVGPTADAGVAAFAARRW